MQKGSFRKVIICLVCIAVLLGMGYAVWRSLQEPAVAAVQVDLHRVGSCTEEMEEVVQARGILKCAESVPVMAGLWGRIIELPAQGAVVKKGDVVLRLDDTGLREQLENQMTSYDTAELNLIRLDAQYQLTEFQETQEVLLSEERLKHAQLEQREELAKPDQRERRLMAIEEELAQLDVDDAEDEYLREQRMFKKGYISAASLESVEQRLENAKAALTELKLRNTLAKKGATEERRVELQKAVDRAKFKMERAEARKARKVNAIVARQNAERKEMERLKYLIDYKTEELKKAITKAGMDGIFMLNTFRDWSTGGTLKERAVGDEQGPHDIVGHIINPQKMEVQVAIHEADFHRLHAGMPVTVTVPAVNNSVYQGHLVRLGAIGRDRNHVDPAGILGGDSHIAVFNAVVNLDETGTSFHPGMSAIVTIRVKRNQRQLLIPRRALVNLNMEGGVAVRMRGGDMRKIKGRYFNHLYFAVDSGLKAGEELEIGRQHSVGE